MTSVTREPRAAAAPVPVFHTAGSAELPLPGKSEEMSLQQIQLGISGSGCSQLQNQQFQCVCYTIFELILIPVLG